MAGTWIDAENSDARLFEPSFPMVVFREKRDSENYVVNDGKANFHCILGLIRRKQEFPGV